MWVLLRFLRMCIDSSLVGSLGVPGEQRGIIQKLGGKYD
jgi:hypothetical protein